MFDPSMFITPKAPLSILIVGDDENRALIVRQLDELIPVISFDIHIEEKDTFLKAKNAIISGSDLHIQYHGEHLGKKDKIEVKVLPRSLNILVP